MLEFHSIQEFIELSSSIGGSPLAASPSTNFKYALPSPEE